MIPLAEHRELSYLLTDVLQNNKKHIIGVLGQDAEIFKAVLSARLNCNVVIFENVADITRHKNECTGVLWNDKLSNMSEEEISLRLAALVQSLTKDGYILVRENLDSSKSLAYYSHLFDSFRIEGDSDDNCLGLELHGAFPVNSSIYGKSNWKDYCWLLHRKMRKLSGLGIEMSFQSFLDQQQYSNEGILSYEMIFGEGFISPGGINKNREFINQIDLKPGQIVLDVGSGVGGNALQMAREWGVTVIGADLSSNMVTLAVEKAHQQKDHRVSFYVVDATKFDFPPNTFDLVYSRDCIIHIADKEALFRKFFKWLKPGGKFQITDYNVGEKEFSKPFQEYLANRHYALWPIRKYVEALQVVGFKDVQGIDITDQFKSTLLSELENAQKHKDVYCRRFSSDTYEHLLEGWNNKLGYIAEGDHKWGLFKARKP